MKTLPFLFLMLSLSVTHAGDDLATRLLERISARRDGGSITAQFKEKRYLPMLKEPVSERGTIAFEPPNKFLRKTDDGNLALSDGTFLWMYYPAFARAEKYSLARKGGPAVLFSALSAVIQLHEVERQFFVTATAQPDGYSLVLMPRQSDLRRMLREATIRLDPELRVVSSSILSTQGDRIETTYSDEKILMRAKLDFRFECPPSTEIIAPLGE